MAARVDRWRPLADTDRAQRYFGGGHVAVACLAGESRGPHRQGEVGGQAVKGGGGGEEG